MDASVTNSEQLRHLTKADPDPHVRQRAQAVLLAGEGHLLAEVARLLHTSAQRIRAWRERFEQEGRVGLADRSRGGRPPKLAQVWRRKRHAMTVPTAGENHKFTIVGALDYASGQVIWQTAAHKGEGA